MPRTTIAKKTSTRKPKGDVSVVKRGYIYCINHSENNTPYWGGHQCNTHVEHDGEIVRWVCSECVAKMVPAPKPKNTPKIDPVTGEKRKRGRPKGSVNKVKVTTTKTTQKGKK